MAPPTVLAVLVGLVGVLPAAGNESWLGADGKPVPLKSSQQVLDFLRTGQVVSSTELAEGINQPSKLLLQKDGIQMHAVFRTVRRIKVREMKRSGRRLELRDDFLFECAAYETALLLGLDNVPPVVERVIDGHSGSLQLWIEKSRTVRQLPATRQSAPLKKRLLKQHEAMWVFDNLIYNDDRNKGNALIGEEGKLWMIDHTQAFRTFQELPYPGAVTRCSRSLYQRLKQLDAVRVAEALERFLQPKELQALLVRRDLLVEHIDSLIAEKGESSVLY